MTSFARHEDGEHQEYGMILSQWEHKFAILAS
jgi:hypothetical protein